MNPEVPAVQARRAACLLAMIVCAMLVLAAPARAAFPGSNGKIAATDGNRLLLLNPDGTGMSEISTDFRPVNGLGWSADGSTLAFSAGADIGFVKSDGSGFRTIDPPDIAQLVSWSPDSSRVVYGAYSLAPPFSFIYTINIDGTDPLLLASGGHLAPKWSPNGDKILFVQTESSGAPGLYTMTPEGQNVTKVPGTGSADTFGDWSPDGERIVFQRRGDLYSIGADGSNLFQITSDGRSALPAWSPDGTKITFVSTRSGHGEINVINADGSGQTQLTSTTHGVILPDWQPVPGPKRSDYRNAAKFCVAERDFLGETDFTQRYGANGNGANAFGKCVSSS